MVRPGGIVVAEPQRRAAASRQGGVTKSRKVSLCLADAPVGYWVGAPARCARGRG